MTLDIFYQYDLFLIKLHDILSISVPYTNFFLVFSDILFWLLWLPHNAHMVLKLKNEVKVKLFEQGSPQNLLEKILKLQNYPLSEIMKVRIIIF